jgi:hypothetical protein
MAECAVPVTKVPSNLAKMAGSLEVAPVWTRLDGDRLRAACVDPEHEEG